MHQVTNQNTLIAPGKVFFDKVNVHRTVNCEWSYDIANSTLTIFKEGLYWFHLSAGIPAHTKTIYTINGLSSISIVKNNTAYQYDQVATDGIFWISSNTMLSVATNYSLFSSSLFGETSLLWFRLDTAMEMLDAFYWVITEYPAKGNWNGNIKYYQITNEDDGWPQYSENFLPQSSGNYFLSYSSAALPGTYSCLKLIKNSNYVNPLATNCVNETSLHNGVEIGRVAVMVHLEEMSDIQTIVENNFPYNASIISNDYIYMQGFFYNPTDGTTSVAWSVVRKSPNFCGFSDPIEFDTVYVNDGNPWNSSLNKVFIPYSGLYLVDLSTHVSNNNGNGNENMQVMLNDNPIIQIKMNTTGFNGCISRSRSTMIQLRTKDILRVRVPNNGSHCLCNNRYLYAFTGFRLYSTD